MGFLLNMLTLPVLGGPRLVHWLAQTVADEARREALDEGGVRAQLLELQVRYDAGELSEDEYERQEETLVASLRAIRELKAGAAGDD